MTRLSTNFTLSELTRSATATRMGFREQFSPSNKVIANLTALCTHILQPLRDRAGVPIFVSSGYRCARLNAYVRGASGSQHLVGEAADINAAGGMTNAELFDLILSEKLPFDQLIWEFGDDDNPAWIHVSYGKRHRRQVLQARKVGNRTVYLGMETKHPASIA